MITLIENDKMITLMSHCDTPQLIHSWIKGPQLNPTKVVTL